MNDSENQKDPFFHLHDEAYSASYNGQLATAGEMVAMGGRNTISLNGAWQFTLDLFDEGLRQKWFADDPLPPEQWTRPRDYDAGAGQRIEVPGCWTTFKPEWMHYEGGAWYTRTIEWQAAETLPRCVLRVGAANYRARVFLDGVFIGSHRGGSTPFFIELSKHLHSGPNRLQIQVDNSRHPSHVPMNHIDWFNDGGLYRDVELLQLPSVFIKDAMLQLKPDGTFSKLNLELTLSEKVDGVACVEIPELGLKQEVRISEGRATQVLDACPELWSPQHPRRYEVIFTFEGDVVSELIGFREIRTDGIQILLNGKPIYLKGICVHEDDVALGKVSTEDDVRRRFSDARALGCNFLRLSHYPHHEHVARIADEMGFLLWEEVPVYWAIDFGNEATFADASNQLRELVRRDRNRASVILWGIGNENADSDARYRFMSALARIAKEEDATRLVGAACLINREKFCIEDRLTADIDVIGINEYFGWYEPDFSGLRRLLHASRPEKPVIISETGADAKAGHHGGVRELFTEECQANIYEQQIAMISEAEYVCGMTPWLLYDFRSERRQTEFNQGFNRKGLIAQDKKTRKQAFDVLATFYHSFERE
jgi:beta-glucuronidase